MYGQYSKARANFFVSSINVPNALELSLILMLVAVLAVSLFKHWRLPAMLGYLFAGTLIGPHALGIVPDVPETRHLAEFGVVFLMFSIGLEFSLPKLHASGCGLSNAVGIQIQGHIADVFPVQQTRQMLPTSPKATHQHMFA